MTPKENGRIIYSDEKITQNLKEDSKMADFTKNYHTHTLRCHHASGADEDYVLAAIEAGLTTLGFSEHTPHFSDNSNYRMPFEEVGDYIDSLLTLREKYKDKIEILIGLESEYYESYFDRLLDYYKGLPLDYIILGQHFYNIDKDRKCAFHESDDARLFTTYIDECVKGIQTGRFSYHAHPDAFKFTGDAEHYYNEVRRLCRAAKDCSVPLELNIQGYEFNRQYPNPEFWKIVGEVGCEVIIGADAHSPEALLRCQKNYSEIVEKFVNRYNLKLVDKLNLRSPV